MVCRGEKPLVGRVPVMVIRPMSCSEKSMSCMMRTTDDMLWGLIVLVGELIWGGGFSMCVDGIFRFSSRKGNSRIGD